MKASSTIGLAVGVALLVTACATAPPGDPAASHRLRFTTTPEFTEIGVKSGVAAFRADCEAVHDAVWVETAELGGECLRYWKSGFATDGARRAIVFFHGDVWLGAGVGPDYLQLSDEKLQAAADDWAARLQAPYIFFGRPGTYGSSGDHMQRRRRAESQLISLALDELKKRYGIAEWVVVGQSGGGHVTASLLAQRDDVVCAVPTSSVSSPRMRWILRGWNTDSTGYADSYEPTEHLVKENKNPKLRIFVVGNVADMNTPWASQMLLTGRARAVGLPVMELNGEGSGSEKHGMSDSGRMVAGWCARDLSDDEIREKARAGLKG